MKDKEQVKQKELAEKKESEIKKVWQQYKENEVAEAREKLILNYSPLVKYVAGRLASTLPQTVDTADLISYGMFGLIDAIEKFDLSREIKFETYAMSRIKGAIIDELRAVDWVPRSVRHKAKELERAYIALENKLKRVPTDEEVAEYLSITIKELNENVKKLSHTSIVALEELWSVGFDKDEKVSLLDTIEDTTSKDPYEFLETSEIKKILAEAIDNLPYREKTVIALYYYEGLTLREIGDILGVTESRVSQLHTKAVLRLRGRLASSRFVFSLE